MKCVRFLILVSITCVASPGFGQWLTCAGHNQATCSASNVGISPNTTAGAFTATHPLEVNGTSRLGGNVFLGNLSNAIVKLYFWPDTSGSWIGTVNGAGIDIYGKGGLHRLLNADTEVTGFSATTALTVKASSTGANVAAFKNSADVSLVNITSGGNVGIGAMVPANRLHVYTPQNADGIAVDGTTNPGLNLRSAGAVKGYLGLATQPTAYFTSALANDIILRSEAGRVLIGQGSVLPAITVNGTNVEVTGKVGIGAFPPAEKLHVFENADVNTLVTVENPNAGLTALGGFRAKSDVAQVSFQAHGSGRTQIQRFGVTLAGWNEFLHVAGNGMLIGTLGTKPLILGTDNNARLQIDAVGQVSIGGSVPGTQTTDKLVVNGAIRATSVIGAVYQDLAEWVPASEAMPPGTVVVVDDRSDNTVMPSSEPYDTRVAGVVSAQPGLLLGIEAPSKEMIATTGRVRVRVDSSGGSIRQGDLLVTSARPGVAMRSRPLDLAGVKIHRPGTLIGKALEALASGEGEILVLLSLQ